MKSKPTMKTMPKPVMKAMPKLKEELKEGYPMKQAKAVALGKMKDKDVDKASALSPRGRYR